MTSVLLKGNILFERLININIIFLLIIKNKINKSTRDIPYHI